MLRNINQTRFWIKTIIAPLLVIAIISSCGRSGPLYLEKEEKNKTLVNPKNTKADSASTPAIQ
jgi:predicted small lipoprotein YifL